MAHSRQGCKQKALVSFEEAIGALKKSGLSEQESKLYRDAGIQRFEFCVELSWKVARKKMGTASSAPKDVIREMAQSGLITAPEDWFGFLEARDLSSHSYDEKIALKIQNLFPDFQVACNNLVKNLSK